MIQFEKWGGEMKKVLIADDNEQNREIAKDVLSSWGYTCYTAVNGPEVLSSACEHDPDVILSCTSVKTVSIITGIFCVATVFFNFLQTSKPFIPGITAIAPVRISFCQNRLYMRN